jgi:hypothetical protein
MVKAKKIIDQLIADEPADSPHAALLVQARDRFAPAYDGILDAKSPAPAPADETGGGHPVPA